MTVELADELREIAAVLLDLAESSNGHEPDLVAAHASLVLVALHLDGFANG